MSRTSMPSRAISVLLAFALACTLNPISSTAFATTPDQTASSGAQQATEQTAAETQTTDSAGSGQHAATDRINELVPVATQKGEGSESAASESGNGNGNAASDAAPASDGSTASDANAQEGAPAPASAPASAASTADPDPAANANPANPADEIDILTASVQLDAASTVVTSNGLTYCVNADGATVTLTGWTDKAPAGTLTIPSQITVGSTTYTVANIGSTPNLGGGARHF